MLSIEQSANGLTLFFKTIGWTKKIQKHLIEGLPKIPIVPKEFFDSCYVLLARTGTKTKVYLRQRGKGGGGVESAQRKSNELHDLKNNLQSVIETVQGHVQHIEQEYASIRYTSIHVYESCWDYEWCQFNLELKTSLENGGDYNQKRDFVLQHLEKRILFSKRARVILSETKVALAKKAISIDQAMKKIKLLIAQGRDLQKSIQIRAHELKNVNDSVVFSVMCMQAIRASQGLPITHFGLLPMDLDECLVWFDQAEASIKEIESIDRMISMEIMKQDETTSNLDRLYISLKTNILHIHSMDCIDFNHLQLALSDRKSIKPLIEQVSNNLVDF